MAPARTSRWRSANTTFCDDTRALKSRRVWGAGHVWLLPPWVRVFSFVYSALEFQRLLPRAGGHRAAPVVPLPHTPKKSGDGSRHRGGPACEEGNWGLLLKTLLTLPWDLKEGDALSEPPFVVPSGSRRGWSGATSPRHQRHSATAPHDLSRHPKGHACSKLLGSWKKSPRAAIARALGPRTTHASLRSKNVQKLPKKNESERPQQATATTAGVYSARPPKVTRRENAALKRPELPRADAGAAAWGWAGQPPLFSLLPVSPPREDGQDETANERAPELNSHSLLTLPNTRGSTEAKDTRVCGGFRKGRRGVSWKGTRSRGPFFWSQ